jgi:hypothetical protein
MALWTVADEDLLCCLCCGEPSVGASCDGFVGGCCWWFCASVSVIHWCLLQCQSGGCRWFVSEVANRRGSVDWYAGLLGGGYAVMTGWGATDGRGAAVTGWDAADGKGAAAGKLDYSRGWWIVFFVIRTVGVFFLTVNSEHLFFFRSNWI